MNFTKIFAIIAFIAAICSFSQVNAQVSPGNSYPTPIPTLIPNVDGGAPAHVTNFPLTQNVLEPSLFNYSNSFTLSGVCTTPLTPTSCAAGSYQIFNLSAGGNEYSYQINSLNGGTVQFESSNDGVNFFTSNLTVAGGTYNNLAVANNTSVAGKFSGLAASSNFVAIVMTVAPTNVVTVYPYMSSHNTGVSIHGSIPLNVNVIALPAPTLQPISLPTSFQTSFPTPIAYATNSSNQLLVALANPTSPYQLVAPYPSASPFPVIISSSVPLTANAGTGFPGVTTSATAPAVGTNIAYIQGTGAGGAVPITGTISVATAPPCTFTTCSSLTAPTALTGNGFTHYATAIVTSASAGVICPTACTAAGIMVGWNGPSNAQCFLTLYNSATPTVGTTTIAGLYSITTTTPGNFAVPIPGTIGGKYTAGLSYAITTTVGGTTACNTVSNALWVEAWYV